MLWKNLVLRGSLIGAAVLLTAAAGADGAVYRWVDSSGQVHFGDQPPAAATIVSQPQQAPAVEAPGTAAAATTAKLAEQCKRKKDQISAYTSASSISETDALGNVHQYTPEERQKLLDTVQKFVADNCATPAQPQ
jgi:hypothetical protein